MHAYIYIYILCICVYAMYMYICIYTYIYICIHIYVCTYVVEFLPAGKPRHLRREHYEFPESPFAGHLLVLVLLLCLEGLCIGNSELPAPSPRKNTETSWGAAPIQKSCACRQVPVFGLRNHSEAFCNFSDPTGSLIPPSGAVIKSGLKAAQV